MKKSFSFQIFLLFVIYSCSQLVSNNAEPAAADTASSSTNTVVKKESESKKDSAATDQQTLFPGGDTLFAKMHIDGVKDLKILPVKIASGKILYAKLIPSEARANLLINQVQMPDSSLDGPFGRELEYKIKTPGIYKLIIGESLMAEGNWKGDFLVKVWVK